MDEPNNEKCIICPWCEEEQYLENTPDNMIVAFTCSECEQPVIVIQDIAIKVDKDILESGDIMQLQDYVLEILEEQYDIPKESTHIDITDMPKSDSDSLEEPKGKQPISEEDIESMKDFLKDLKFPREGHMFE